MLSPVDVHLRSVRGVTAARLQEEVNDQDVDSSTLMDRADLECYIHIHASWQLH
jgi:hypothetical protein